ncbi:unnamed protein product, partial [Meganyctiphanes norvegica]
VPGKSTNVSSKSVTPYSLEVNWNQPLDNLCLITNYTLTWNNISGRTEQVNVTEPPYNITGLTSCINYTITVIAYTEEGPGEPSDTMTTETDIPGKSTNVTTKSITPYSLEVNWNQPLDNLCLITNYTLTWNNISGGTEQVNVTEQSYNITGLASCINYTITVIVYTEKGPGEPSDTVILTTKTDIPGKSTNLTTKSVTPSSLEVNWNQPSDNLCLITNYTVTWTNASGGTEQVNVTEPHYNITGLAACINYTITFIAYTEKGPGEPSDIVILTTETDVPGKCTNVTTKRITPYSLEVNWNQPLDNLCPITNYTLTWTNISGGTEQVNVTEPPYNLTGLAACINYTITVTAYTEKGPGEPSDTVILTTETDVPGKSTNVTTKSVTPYSLEVNWNQPLDNLCLITNYTLTWTNISGGTEQVNVTEPPYNLTGLAACLNYTITVIAYTEKGPAEPSDTVILTTETDVPGKISNVTSNIITPYSLEVNWSRPLDHFCHITNYTIKWANSSGGEELKNTVTEPPYNITGLASCTNYTITVIAYTKKGPGEPRDTVTLATEMD